MLQKLTQIVLLQSFLESNDRLHNLPLLDKLMQLSFHGSGNNIPWNVTND